ncbi:NAD-dependent epimerase/dehydratase family protein [Aeromonas veronii]|uniref:NAD-dependent epimerase/dehydratase family protein n=1 Tax=Aeromonas veronii TaxID=654 RepID=UPI0013189E1D|nr:NAD(P)-dependent oxidoreductase [Aeromonas veronii]QHC07519.1 NAD-dependent epimerase/dehydratase family protein [Aeromonas veronii]
MKVALIGGNSFIASAINKSVHFEMSKICCCARSNPSQYPEFKFFDYPNTDISFLLDFDLIVNCLGVGVQSNRPVTASEIYKSNTFFPIELIEYLNENNFNGTLITFGSYFEIGNNDQNVAYTEVALQNSMLSVPNDYCISKRLLTKYISSKVPCFNLYHLILPSVYGPGENENRIIPYTINNIKKSVALEFSEGLQIRQFLHVNDLINAMKILVDKKAASGIYNVATSYVCSIRDLIKSIGSVLDTEIDDNCFGLKLTRDTSLKSLQLNGEKLFALGFSPEINIKSGIIGYL